MTERVPAVMSEVDRDGYGQVGCQWCEAPARQIIVGKIVIALLAREPHQVIAGEESNDKGIYLVKVSRERDQTRMPRSRGASTAQGLRFVTGSPCRSPRGGRH